MTERKKRRPRKPASQHRGIEAVWHSPTQSWYWRARIHRSGVVSVGSFRATQDEAAADYRAMRETLGVIPKAACNTLGEALTIVRADALARGVPRSTVDTMHAGHSAFLLRMWNPSVLLDQIRVDDVVRMIRLALEQGRSPNTLAQKDLPLLHRCYTLSGADSPVPEARKRCAKQIAYRKPMMSWFNGEELADLLHRIRFCQHKSPKGTALHLPRAAWFADVVEFLAFTGLRLGELGRVRLCDIDIERRTIEIVTPKDRGNPRTATITEGLVPVVERLISDAKTRHGDKPETLLVAGALKSLPPIFHRWQRILGDRRLNGRALRHTFATGLLASGASALDVMDLAGHRRLETTSRYVHAVSPTRRHALARWERRVRGDGEGPSEEPRDSESGRRED